MDESESKIIIFFLSPQVRWMRKIAEMVLNNKTRNIGKEYLLLLTPRKSYLCMKELEEMNVGGLVRVESFNFGLMGLGGDVLSMEWTGSYLELFGKSDQTGLQIIAEAVLKLQYALGDFSHVYGQGDLASVRRGLCRVSSTWLGLRTTTRLMSTTRASTISPSSSSTATWISSPRSSPPSPTKACSTTSTTSPSTKS